MLLYIQYYPSISLLASSLYRMLLYFTVRNPWVFPFCSPPIPAGSKWAGLDINAGEFKS
jgi:hypothetical protein